jgi:murein peptide amidase A
MSEPVEQWLTSLANLAGRKGYDVVQWGESGGLPLLGLIRPSEPGSPRIYLSSGIHGDEPAGPLAIERLLSTDALPSSVHLTLCPLLNPRGYAAGTRETPEGIDLNRDYRSLSTVEAAGHVRWLGNLPPNDLYLSLHEDWETEGFYLYEIDCAGRPRYGEEIVSAVSPVIPPEKRSELDSHHTAAPGIIRHPPHPDEPDNWPEAIYHVTLYPHLSYTFETPSALPLETRIQAQVIAVTTAIRLFRENRCHEAQA